jgi:feruloyl esterase
MTSLRLPDVRILEAIERPSSKGATSDAHAAHCRITGVIGREIRFTVLLPDSWNGRFMMGGGGGYVGSIQNSAAGTVDLGYATAGTDTGHQSEGTDAKWALDDVERQLNFAHLAIHRTAETAKAIVSAYYGGDARYSYFSGCSTGGRQALMEAQRYPDDFDGIVSGAPVYDWTRALANGLKISQAMFPNPHSLDVSVVSPETLRMLDATLLEACDASDGVADGVIDDPDTCNVDQALAHISACASDAPGTGCLTKAQRAAIARIYAPLQDPRGLIYEGQPAGGEAAAGGWRPWISGVNEGLLKAGGVPSLSFGFSTEYFRNFIFSDPKWDYSTYDIAQNWRRDTRLSATMLNADNPDLGPFKARNGKLLLWHGWSDPALNPRATIRYVNEVRKKDPASESYARLFLLPGVLHCSGGNGPDRVDWTTAIVDWVEKGTAPSQLLATKRGQDGNVVRSRPVCSYPKRAVYSGSGNTDDASSFVCR